MRIVLGDRTIPNAAELLRSLRRDKGLGYTGHLYYDHLPATSGDSLVIEDLGVTVLLNSRAGWRAGKSLVERGKALDLTSVKDIPLEGSTPGDRDRVADLIAGVVEWDGFRASLATKVLHKKKPRLIPILDNQSIFGAYMQPDWPAQSASSLSEAVRDKRRIRDALERIWYDLVRLENTRAWSRLSAIEPRRSRVELFDMVWWAWFRKCEPA